MHNKCHELQWNDEMLMMQSEQLWSENDILNQRRDRKSFESFKIAKAVSLTKIEKSLSKQQLKLSLDAPKWQSLFVGVPDGFRF